MSDGGIRLVKDQSDVGMRGDVGLNRRKRGRRHYDIERDTREHHKRCYSSFHVFFPFHKDPTTLLAA